MKDRYGLSYGDVQKLLDEAFGISVSRGGASQVVVRAAELGVGGVSFYNYGMIPPTRLLWVQQAIRYGRRQG